MKGVNIFLAPGFEDMEALSTRDILIRGGVNVTLVSITDEYIVESSHGLQVSVDSARDDFEFEETGTSCQDVMIFPGGMPGSKNLANDTELMERMKEHYSQGGTVAAICAAPGLVLSQLDIPEGLRFTCFDGFEDALIEKGGVFTKESAVEDSRIITGRGAGHAVAFGLKILEYLKGKETAAKVAAGLML